MRPDILCVVVHPVNWVEDTIKSAIALSCNMTKSKRRHSHIWHGLCGSSRYNHCETKGNEHVQVLHAIEGNRIMRSHIRVLFACGLLRLYVIRRVCQWPCKLGEADHVLRRGRDENYAWCHFAHAGVRDACCEVWLAVLAHGSCRRLSMVYERHSCAELLSKLLIGIMTHLKAV